MATLISPTARHLVTSQALFVGGSAVDMTLTGIVGARMAPVPLLATLPFSMIFVVAGLSTVLVSKSISRWGHRKVFTAVAVVAAFSGVLSAVAVQIGDFWLFLVGTSLIGVYSAGSGYYRYLAADSTPNARASAVSRVLAGGLIAALVGPFLATALSGLTPVPFVASYLLVALLGAAAAIWNARLPEAQISEATTTTVGSETRRRREIWRQPSLLLGVAVAVFAALSMLSMMTAGPMLGMASGRSPAEAAFAIQLHMVGMFAPGLVAVRAIGRFGERAVALTGVALILLAGAAAAISTDLPLYLTSMLLVGVGWNLSYSGGTALIAAAYRPAERGLVQPIAELAVISAQVIGSLSAVEFATPMAWHGLGYAFIIAAVATFAAFAIAGDRARRISPNRAAEGTVAQPAD